MPDVFHKHRFADISHDTRFTNPFEYRPSDECVEAARIVRQHIREHCAKWSEELSHGKMLGVLVCRDSNGDTGFLAAFSGTIGSRLNHEWFVPAVLDYEKPNGVFKTEEAQISALNEAVSHINQSHEYRAAIAEYDHLKKDNEQEIAQVKTAYAANKLSRKAERERHPELGDKLNSQSQYEKAEIRRLKQRWKERLSALEKKIDTYRDEIASLKSERTKRSNILQRWLFRTMKLHNANGKSLSVRDIFLQNRHIEPPSGSGECCAPRLLNYAFTHSLTPISMAEFWVGDSPAGEIRIDGEFYPACQAKCAPLLKWMLDGIECEPAKFGHSYGMSIAIASGVQILYEDRWLLAVNKPSGLLTVSGDGNSDSLMRRVRAEYPNISGPGYVHRLDQPTSGIVLIAKDRETHSKMQALFENREIRKRYTAILTSRPDKAKGVISLPLLPNSDDRPRQMVDFVRGKKAVTEYEVTGHSSDSSKGVHVSLYPRTGRTHQLRVHCASPMGLGCPIVGDNLYGRTAERLYLHADRIEFTHPYTGEAIIIDCPAKF